MKQFDKFREYQTLLSLCLVLCCISVQATAVTTYVISPMNASMNSAPTSLMVTAKKVTGLVSYKIDISTDLTFATIFKTSADTSNTQVFNDLAYGTRYYARVSIDGGLTYGMKTYFTTAQPILASPMNASSNAAPGSLLITSKTVPGATSYTIDLSTTSAFTSIYQTHTGSASQVFTNLGYGKRYYARVKTNLKKSDNITSYGYGPSTYFTTTSLAVISPKSASLGVRPDSVVVVSQTVSGATSYTIELSLSNTFSTIAQSHTGSNSQVFTNLAYGKKYYARVKTNLLSDSTNSYGAIAYFTTASPDITNPARGAMGVAPKSVMIVSKTVPGASIYTIELSLSGTFNPVIQSHTGSNSQAFTDLGYGKRYYARVKTNLSSEYGAVSNFTTASPDVTSPINGATNVSTSVVITSKTVPGASSYTFEVSTSNMFTNVLTATGTNSQPFNLEPSKKYYVRVKTDLTKNDSTSFGYGKIVYFTTGAPAAPVANSNIFSAKQSASVSELSVYPNPSSGSFNILVSGEEKENVIVNIYDSFGNPVHTSSQLTNSLIELGQELKGGTYLLKISTSSGTKSVRVVKE